jgi:hypothetical protein
MQFIMDNKLSKFKHYVIKQIFVFKRYLAVTHFYFKNTIFKCAFNNSAYIDKFIVYAMCIWYTSSIVLLVYIYAYVYKFLIDL